jgi:hypothetical protein
MSFTGLALLVYGSLMYFWLSIVLLGGLAIVSTGLISTGLISFTHDPIGLEVFIGLVKLAVIVCLYWFGAAQVARQLACKLANTHRRPRNRVFWLGVLSLLLSCFLSLSGNEDIGPLLSLLSLPFALLPGKN